MMRQSILLFLFTYLVGAFPTHASAQDMRRVFKHRDVWVENIGTCPTSMTDRLIDYFQSQGQEVRLINVNPFNEEPGKDCKQDSLFLVYLKDLERKFRYPGYTRLIERNGTFVPHSTGEVEDLSFNLKELDLRVVEVLKGAMYMTRLNFHGVELKEGTNLRQHEVRAIIEELHSAYQPNYDHLIVGNVLLQEEDDDSVWATIETKDGQKERYRLVKLKGLWTLVNEGKLPAKGQTPLPGS